MNTSIKSSQRTLALFELFSLKQQPLTVKEISLGLDMPLSSTSMLVKSLCELGYLERSLHDRKFYPTLRIALLGTWMRRRHRRAGQLPELLSRVSKETGEPTVLAMRNGIYSQYLITQQGNAPDRLVIESGMLRPLACSATGWCLLTLESQKTIDKIVRRTVAEVENQHWKKTASTAREQVALTTRRGYALSSGETVAGRGAIAILLPSMPGAHAMAAAAGSRIEEVLRKKDLILESLSKLAEEVRNLKDQRDPDFFA